jgi:hypothetical protein
MAARVFVSDSPGGVIWHANGLTAAPVEAGVPVLFDDPTAAPSFTGCTETTEGSLCLALLGKDVFKITEKLASLDLGDPKRKAPACCWGLFPVTCQIVALKNDPADAAVLVACSRGLLTTWCMRC